MEVNGTIITSKTCIIKWSIRIKNIFAWTAYNALAVCLKINGKQTIEEGSDVQVSNHHKQLQAPSAIYIDPESKRLNRDHADISYTDKYQDHIVSSCGYKVVCIDGRFSKPVQIYGGENAVCWLIKEVIEGVEYCKQTNLKITLIIAKQTL